MTDQLRLDMDKRVAREVAGRGHEADLEALVPIALELAEKAGPEGIIAGDVRLVAERRGLIGKSPNQRTLSWLTWIGKKAGLHNTGRRRLSTIGRNDHVIYVLPRYAR